MSNMNPPITFYDFTILGIFVISIVGFVWGVLRFWWYDLGRYLAGEPKRSLFLEIAHLFITPGYPFYVLYVLFSTHMHPSNLPSLAVRRSSWPWPGIHKPFLTWLTITACCSHYAASKS